MEGGVSDSTVLGLFAAVALFFLLVFVAAISASRKGKPSGPRSEQTSSAITLRTLQARHGGELKPTRLTFDHAGVEVRIDVELPFPGRQGRVRLQLRNNLAPVTFGPEATFSGGDIRTGDTEFDGVVKVGGDVTAALTLLTPQTRRLIQRAVLAGFRMDDDGGPRLHISTSGDELESMLPHLELALSLAPLLRPDRDPRLILERLRTEPLADGRMALAMQLPYHDLEPHVAELARLAEAPVRLALASRLDHPELWQTLPERELVAALRDERPAIVHFAIAALGRFGTIEAVPSLESRKSYDKKTRDLATDAILAIQSRATGSRGDLALATHDGGLALTEERR